MYEYSDLCHFKIILCVFVTEASGFTHHTSVLFAEFQRIRFQTAMSPKNPASTSDDIVSNSAHTSSHTVEVEEREEKLGAGTLNKACSCL